MREEQSPKLNQASRWSPTDYANNAAFVPALGGAAVDLLAPQPGELIVDLGCGDGVLTRKIMEAGARVIGLDASPEMVEAARARGVDAFVADAQALDLTAQAFRFGQFDGAFSNAALHWMLEPLAVATGVYAVLRPGGRFVGEMGGAGNLAAMRQALREVVTAAGYALPSADPQWYATALDFVHLYEAAGFTDVRAELIERPTPLPHGVVPWVLTFRRGMLQMAGVPEADHHLIAGAVERRLAPKLQRPDGSWFADYVRLRFSMRKPG
jgi:trans-aconitate methyltransferase